MKDSVAIVLLLFCMIALSGVAVQVHYSAGKLKSISLVLDKSSDESRLNSKKECPKSMNKSYTHTNPISIRDNSFTAVLKCVSIVSHGFFEAYDDDADTSSVCNTCSVEPTNTNCPQHLHTIE